MANDIRQHDSPDGLKEALSLECAREEENALYTSTTFFIWLRFLKFMRACLWVGGAGGSALAASHILRGGAEMKFVMAVAALSAVLLPGIARALRIDAVIRDYAEAAGKLKNLQGELRRVRLIWSMKPFAEFEIEARKLFKLMNDARKPSLTPPEFCFRLACSKIKAGHYNHDADAVGQTTQYEHETLCTRT